MTEEERKLGALFDKDMFSILEYAAKRLHAPTRVVLVHSNTVIFLWAVFQTTRADSSCMCWSKEYPKSLKHVKLNPDGDIHVFLKESIQAVHKLISDIGTAPGMSVTVYNWSEK